MAGYLTFLVEHKFEPSRAHKAGMSHSNNLQQTPVKLQSNPSHADLQLLLSLTNKQKEILHVDLCTLSFQAKWKSLEKNSHDTTINISATCIAPA